MSHISLYCLPNEIICHIIKSLDIRSVTYFMETCKKFYDLANNQVLWKSRALNSVSRAIHIGMLENCDGDWYKCLKEFILLKNYIQQEINKAHAKYEGLDLLNYIKPLYGFIVPVLLKKCDLYYAINILIELYQEAYEKAKEAERKIQQMSTDLYYIKIHLAFLMHTYLITKWGYAEAFNHLLPETLLHFVLQWLDYTTFHFEEENQKLFDNLAIEVENLLGDKHPLKKVLPEKRKDWSMNYHKENMWPSNECKQVLRAVTEVVFKSGHMKVTDDINVDTLDVQKVWKNNLANFVTILIIYEAVARRCGVMCRLIVYDIYLLEWSDNLTNESYTINRLNGSLQICRPYMLEYGREYAYSATRHVHYILTFFKNSDEIQIYRGDFKILTFVDGGSEVFNYFNFIPSYCKCYVARYIKNEYNIRQLDATYLQLIKTSLTLRELSGPADEFNTYRPNAQ